MRFADRPVKTASIRETRRLKKLAHWFLRWLIGPWIDATGGWLERRRPWIEARRADVDRLRDSPRLARVRRVMLAIDSWIDSSVWGSGHSASGSYERFALYMERFHVTGVKRIAIEVGCEVFTLSIAGGFVLLALAIPAFELTSEDWLKKQDLAVTFLDRYGQEVGRRGIRHDDAVPFDELPPNLIHALISTEDRRFFDHYGIDVIGTMRALLVNSRSEGVRQGGSSLTQQLAKNLFLSNERTLPRKVNEAFLALWLEAHLSKREILSLYLDRAYLGGGTFGVQAASEFYFGKSVRDLTLPEAAMIAGLFKAPTKYAPHINLPAARARANDVLNNMVEAGYLTAGQIYAAQRNPATPVDRRQETSPDWYLDWAYNEIRDLAADGKFGDETVLTVRTGLDPALQQHVEDTIESYLRQYGQSLNVGQAAAVILDPNGVGARHRRRSRLWRQPVQPRHRRAAPARLLVQALRLPDGPDERQVQAELYDLRRLALSRQLVPAQLRRRDRRQDHAVVGSRHVAEHGGGAALDRDRRRHHAVEQGQRRPRQDHRHGAAHGSDHAAARHGLASAGGRRGEGHRAGQRLHDLSQRRQARAGLCRHHRHQPARRSALRPRPRTATGPSRSSTPTRSR